MIEIPEKFRRAAARRGLSPRQVQVCYLIGTGRSWKMVADELEISIGTLRVHAERISRRIGAWNCVAAFAKILNFEI